MTRTGLSFRTLLTKSARATTALAITVAVLSAACTASDNASPPTPIADSAAPSVSSDSSGLPEAGESNATVERVVDGDTIVADIGGTRERVRLLGIDTPESVAEDRPDQCYGAESSEYLKALLPPGTPITIIRDVEARDRFDRLLGYIVRTDDQLFINLDLIEKGFAGPFSLKPNTFYTELFATAAARAEADGVGLWGVCGGPDVPLG